MERQRRESGIDRELPVPAGPEPLVLDLGLFLLRPFLLSE